MVDQEDNNTCGTITTIRTRGINSILLKVAIKLVHLILLMLCLRWVPMLVFQEEWVKDGGLPKEVDLLEAQ